MSLIPVRPSWASKFGRDKFDIFADMIVETEVQRFRYCPPGTFTMGSPDDEPGRFDNEGPQHLVRLTKGFWLGDTPVTQALWMAVGWENNCRFFHEQRPVEYVNWHWATAFCTKLGCQLPTEAQWEYACRAGTTGATYDDSRPVNDLAWCTSNSDKCTSIVGLKRPNPWGLYDMLGNVYEWCRDSEREYAAADVNDPCGAINNYRVIRGGSWFSLAYRIRAAFRIEYDPITAFGYLGFRLLKPIE